MVSDGDGFGRCLARVLPLFWRVVPELPVHGGGTVDQQWPDVFRRGLSYWLIKYELCGSSRVER